MEPAQDAHRTRVDGRNRSIVRVGDVDDLVALVDRQALPRSRRSRRASRFRSALTRVSAPLPLASRSVTKIACVVRSIATSSPSATPSMRVTLHGESVASVTPYPAVSGAAMRPRSHRRRRRWGFRRLQARRAPQSLARRERRGRRRTTRRRAAGDRPKAALPMRTFAAARPALFPATSNALPADAACGIS